MFWITSIGLGVVILYILIVVGESIADKDWEDKK